MRLSVECGGFTEAADVCRTANQIAALLSESLSTRLADCARMAGNDATSSDFARAYDDGAREAVHALADLTHSFIGLGRLLEASGLNHASAESASAGLTVSAYVNGSLDEDSNVRIRPAPPPSCLGGPEPSLGPMEAWILDQVEGFVWPGADVGALRLAASGWRRGASSVSGLTDHVGMAVTFLERQHSPEVPLALAALDELATLIGDTARQLDSLATACEEYAAAVEEVHARTRTLLVEIGRMVVEGIALSAIVAGFTGGLGGSAAAGVALARIRAYAPRFHALLVALRAGTATATARLRTAHDELVAVRARAEKFLRVPVRNEVGEMKHPLAWAAHRKAGWLAAHEKPPGHTIADHVGKSVDELVERCRTKGLARSSSFTDELTAERMTGRALDEHASAIRDWLRSGTTKALPVEVNLRTPTGITVTKDAEVIAQTGVRVVLIRDSSMPRGWQILTAYPS